MSYTPFQSMELTGIRPLTLLHHFGLMSPDTPTTRNVAQVPPWIFSFAGNNSLHCGFGAPDRDIVDAIVEPIARRRQIDDSDPAVAALLDALIPPREAGELFVERRLGGSEYAGGLRETEHTPVALLKVLRDIVLRIMAERAGTAQARWRVSGNIPVRAFAAGINAPLSEADSDQVIAAIEAVTSTTRKSWQHPLPVASDTMANPIAEVYRRSDDEEPVQIFPGLIVVIGATATGKSSVLRGHATNSNTGLSGVLGAGVIDYGEPAGTMSAYGLNQLARQIGYGLSAQRAVIVDSLKQLLLTSRDNLGTGGLSGVLNAQMSDWSSTLAKHGRSMVVTINPLGVREDAIEEYIKTVEGVAEAVIWTRGLTSSVLFNTGAASAAATLYSRRGNARGAQGVSINLAQDWV